MGSLELTDRNYKLTFKLDQAIDPCIEMKEFLIKVIDPQSIGNCLDLERNGATKNVYSDGLFMLSWDQPKG